VSALTANEVRRYSRQRGAGRKAGVHLVLKDFGGAGQQRLRAARVLVIGAGGLGSLLIAYLAGAGIGAVRCRAQSARSLCRAFTRADRR
jgi:adenylyltransferase/sulfurtransferase